MGVVFLVVVPTEKYEKILRAGRKWAQRIRFTFEIYHSYNFAFSSTGILNADIISAAKNYNIPALRKNDLNNIPPPDDNPNAILKMEVELRDKNQAKKRGRNKGKQFGVGMDLNVGNFRNVDVPMEKVKTEQKKSSRWR